MNSLSTIKDCKGQKVIFLNVRSLYGNISQIQTEFNKSNFLCLGFSETWLNMNIVDSMVHIDGYNIIRLDRKSGKKGGGLMIYILKRFGWEYLAQSLNVSNTDLELVTILIKRPNQKDLCLSFVYAPPKSNPNKMIDHLDALANRVTESGKEWVIGGDFNVDFLTKAPHNRKLRIVGNFAKRNALTQLISKPTRIAQTTSTLLDHIYSNTPDNVCQSGVLSYGLSDHDITYLVLKRNLPNKKKTTFSFRSMKNFDRVRLDELLKNADWEKFYASDDPNTTWSILLNIYIECINIVAPVITMSNVKEKEDWVTPELLCLIRNRDNEKELADKLNSESHRKEFKKLRKEVKTTVHRAKRNYVKMRIEDLDPNSRNYWAELKKIAPMGKKKGASVDPDMIALTDENGDEISEGNTANYINEYFVSIGPKLSEQITFPNDLYIDTCKLKSSLGIMYNWEAVTENEIERLIKDLDLHKGSNVPEINSKLLKVCLTYTTAEITYLFNQICITGIFPDKWKEATIVPIHKGDSKKKVENYRPISLLNIGGKLMEKVLHGRLLCFLNAKSFFTDSQGGFRPGLGTNETVSRVLEYNHLDDNSSVLTVFYDLKKAFDTIDHNILLAKLEGCGIDGISLKLLKNYLMHRYQRCRANGSNSDKLPLQCGVPQGSTLGPLFFIIYVNDMVDCVEGVEVSLYADDTAFYLGGKDAAALNHDMSLAVAKFHDWCQMNRLTLNLTKSKIMLFSHLKGQRHKNFMDNVDIRIMETKLDIVQSYKYLGIQLDSGLKFINHIAKVKQQIYYRLHILRQVRWILGFDDSLLLYKTSILCFFDQGDIFYNAATRHELAAMQTIQNKCLRVIFGSKKKWPGTELAHKNCNLLKIKDRRNISLVKYAHIKSFNTNNLQSHNTRQLRSSNRLLLKEQRCKTNTLEKSFVIQSIRLWNKLPDYIKEIRNYYNFKSGVKTEVLLQKLNFPE